MKKQTFVRNVHSLQCKVLNIRLTDEKLKTLKIAATMAGLSAPLFVEKQLESFFNKNHEIIENAKQTAN